jgi:hypothetical protein
MIVIKEKSKKMSNLELALLVAGFLAGLLVLFLPLN